ncbi:MAG: aryl-sulfate sulfotransferase [Chloroflexi bacterium]|nr:aryl-sulfate sulfotransferase [Chloroflexota bacterium]
MKQLRWILVLMATVAVAIGAASATLGTAEQTVGLFQNDPGAYNGYTLFAPNRSNVTYLINNDGEVVNTWTSAFGPGVSTYLKENGNLIRTANIRETNGTFGHLGGGGGRIEEYSWDGTLLWGYNYSVSIDEYLEAPVFQHHDIAVLPNGNVLILAWAFKSGAQAIAAGRDPALMEDGLVFPESIIEVEPQGETGGNIVWEWNLWDHMIQDFDETQQNFGVVADHPELVDINFGNTIDDWIHANALNYNEELDQIMISARAFNELWVIDHSTTTEEAASHSGGQNGMGGDLLYRWGNPQAYDRGDESDRQLFRQHDTHWIGPGLDGEGNILIFNNGQQREPEEFSTVVEIVPPVDESGNYTLGAGAAFGPAAPMWSYRAPNPTDFYSSFISGAQRLPNGNTLIDSGAQGHFFEVTSAGDIVWDYVNPVTGDGPLAQGIVPEDRTNIVFRATRYGKAYPAFEGKDLVPMGVIELPKSDATPEPTATPELIVGDVNCDGTVSSIDAALVLQYGAGLVSTLSCQDAADVNGDGSIDSLDAVLILQHAAGLLPALPF